MGLKEGTDFLFEALSLDLKQRGLIMRVSWITFVTVHIFWVCGWLTVFGVISPFADAADLAELQRTAAVSARLSLAQEIRTQLLAKCLVTDPRVKESLAVTIDKLQIEYSQYAGTRYPEPKCD